MRACQAKAKTKRRQKRKTTGGKSKTATIMTTPSQVVYYTLSNPPQPTFQTLSRDEMTKILKQSTDDAIARYLKTPSIELPATIIPPPRVPSFGDETELAQPPIIQPPPTTPATPTLMERFQPPPQSVLSRYDEIIAELRPNIRPDIDSEKSPVVKIEPVEESKVEAENEAGSSGFRTMSEEQFKNFYFTKGVRIDLINRKIRQTKNTFSKRLFFMDSTDFPFYRNPDGTFKVFNPSE